MKHYMNHDEPCTDVTQLEHINLPEYANGATPSGQSMLWKMALGTNWGLGMNVEGRDGEWHTSFRSLFVDGKRARVQEPESANRDNPAIKALEAIELLVTEGLRIGETIEEARITMRLIRAVAVGGREVERTNG